MTRPWRLSWWLLLLPLRLLGQRLPPELQVGAPPAARLAVSADAPPVPYAPRRRLMLQDQVLASLDLVLARLTGQARAPILWEYEVIQYSLTVPSEAVATAVIATVDQGAADGQPVDLALYRPEEKGGPRAREVLTSGAISTFSDIPTEEAARIVLEIRHGTRVMNYSISVLRSTITSSYEFVYPDPAAGALPQRLLAGLDVFDQYGLPAAMRPTYFDPQKSQYIAIVGLQVTFANFVASRNDPNASIDVRMNGQEWQVYVSGINSQMQAVPVHGWLLVELRVSTPAPEAYGLVPITYQIVVARETKCDPRCRSCYGPGEDQCLACASPLVLVDGRCEVTSCAPTHYYEWQSYQCRRCHHSCAQCRGPGTAACTLCPALYFLAPEEWEDPSGPCVIKCPIGTFGHPSSRRCKMPPAVAVRTFYMRFIFRVEFAVRQGDIMLQESVVNATAFVLGVSLSDVRPYRMGKDLKRLMMTVEVVSPFMPRADADRIGIDIWFGAFVVPVDEVMSQSWEDLHPPLPELPIEPFLPAWAWGILASVGSTILIIIPTYCFFFRRLSNQRKRYLIRVTVDPVFVDSVVRQAPAKMIRTFVVNEDAKKSGLG